MHVEHAIVIMRHVALALAYLRPKHLSPPLVRDADGALRVTVTRLVEGRLIDWSERDVAQAITRPKALEELLAIAAEYELVFEYDKGVFTVKRLPK